MFFYLVGLLTTVGALVLLYGLGGVFLLLLPVYLTVGLIGFVVARDVIRGRRNLP